MSEFVFLPSGFMVTPRKFSMQGMTAMAPAGVAGRQEASSNMGAHIRSPKENDGGEDTGVG